MEVVLVRARAPLFSVRHLETYQIAVSYTMAPPSTIVGAVGRGLAIMGECSGSEDCINAARSLVLKARDVAVPSARFGVVLKRARGILEERRMPKSFKETGFFDALNREYVFAAEKLFLIVPSDNRRVLERALWHLERLGDTESLIAVYDVAVERAERCEGLVNVVVRWEVARGGGFVVQPGEDERGERQYFAFPVVAKEGGLYVPGGVKIDGGILCAGEVRFPESHDW
ncbi:CRISPR-associated protein Cas5, subtype I-A/APERN [Pyrobaculum oguniense TE7]|uniref:CRISPR-associated protein Cas5, subtype I-A/APERN n=1 Tax=Pyrobaculum oguniense (strain DSM 13380 / JCM 10595 / TE7) TaxID=698757 RepID=H6QA51_PYROT|nr:CRISPR-associated protein Cas5, subtype I-A/APERN [Pyrobaculum oguniense TE7]